jgi:hypothetical protein
VPTVGEPMVSLSNALTGFGTAVMVMVNVLEVILAV